MYLPISSSKDIGSLSQTLIFNNSASELETFKTKDWFQTGFWLLLMVVVLWVAVNKPMLCFWTILKTQYGSDFAVGGVKIVQN